MARAGEEEGQCSSSQNPPTWVCVFWELVTVYDKKGSTVCQQAVWTLKEEGDLKMGGRCELDIIVVGLQTEWTGFILCQAETS